MFPSAVQLFLEAAAGRKPTAGQWSRLLEVAGVDAATAGGIAGRLGTAFHLGAYDTAAVRDQLQVWADGMRLRGDSAAADLLQEAARSLGEAAGAPEPGDAADPPARPGPGVAGAPPTGPPRSRTAPGPGRLPRPPSRPPSRPPRQRQPRPERGTGAQSGRRDDGSRPRTPQRRVPGQGHAGLPARPPAASDGVPDVPEAEAWPPATKALLAVLILLLLATLVGLGLALTDEPLPPAGASSPPVGDVQHEP